MDLNKLYDVLENILYGQRNDLGAEFFTRQIEDLQDLVVDAIRLKEKNIGD